MWWTWLFRKLNASFCAHASKVLSARVEARVAYFTRGRVTRRARGEQDDGPVMRAVVWILSRVVDFMHRRRL